MLRKIFYIAVLFFTISFTGCEDYLANPADTAAHIPKTVKELYESFYTGIRWNKCKYRTSISDDIDLPFTEKEYVEHDGFAKNCSELYSVLFQRDKLAKLNDGGIWGICYGSIHHANYVLSRVNDKSLVGTKEERKLAEGYARFERARNMFDLVTSYCNPYCPGKNDKDLGIVLPKNYSLDFNKNNLGRQSLKASWDFIEQDVLSAVNLPDTEHKWLPSGKAVCAFAARFYLMEGKYKESLKYANKALSMYSDLDNYTTYKTQYKIVRGFVIEIIPEIYNKLSYDDMSIYDVKQEYLIEMQQMENAYIPSKALLDLYDNDAGSSDMRRKEFVHMGLGALNTILKARPATAGGTTAEWPSLACYNMSSMMVAFPNVPEMMLTKAECLVEVNGDIAGAKTLLNKLRSNRINKYDPISVNKLNTKDAVLQFIYDERRRERPFILRSLDIRRFKAVKDKPVTITRVADALSSSKFDVPYVRTVYTLKDEDYCNKIFNGDITLSEGYLKQNK